MSRATKLHRRRLDRRPKSDGLSGCRFRRRWTIDRIARSILLAGLAARVVWTTAGDARREPDFHPLAAGAGRIVEVRDDGALVWQAGDNVDQQQPQVELVRLLGVRCDKLGRRSVPPTKAIDWLRANAVERPAAVQLDRRRVDAGG